MVYEDVCIRNTKNPIFMDTSYSYSGTDRDKLPVFTNITLRDVHIAGGGKVTLDGFDAVHRLGMRFDNVAFSDPASIQVEARDADLTIGPGPSSLPADGEGVKVSGAARTAPRNSCSGKFVDFPAK